MMGFKSFYSAQTTIAGIELYRMLKKGQHINASNTPAFEQFYALACIITFERSMLGILLPNRKFATHPYFVLLALLGCALMQIHIRQIK
jgi:hypothetical protein